MNRNLLMVFMKNPEINKVKTRLAASIGGQNALHVYRKLLEYTHGVVTGLSSIIDKQVWYSSQINRTDRWEKGGFYKHRQEGEDLGEKMAHAFREGFAAGYERIVIIGSDCPGLQTEHLEEAFEGLEKKDSVVGPAEDGGYYLLGLNAFYPSVFEGINWSKSSVLPQTMDRLKTERLSVYTLEQLNDIDTIEDLKKSGMPLL